MRGSIGIIFPSFKFGDDPISSLYFSFIGWVVFDGMMVAVDWVYVAKTSPSPVLRIPFSLIEFNFCSVAMLRTPPLYSVPEFRTRPNSREENSAVKDYSYHPESGIPSREWDM